MIINFVKTFYYIQYERSVSILNAKCEFYYKITKYDRKKKKERGWTFVFISLKFKVQMKERKYDVIKLKIYMFLILNNITNIYLMRNCLKNYLKFYKNEYFGKK